MGNTYDKIKIVEPDKFNSKLMDNIFEFEELRDSSNMAKKFRNSGTKPSIFFSFISIFQIVESIASTRIEWNHTTVSNFIDKLNSKDNEDNTDEWIKEIKNNFEARNYIDDLYRSEKNIVINRKFISELHTILMKWLNPDKEWDTTPGEYRKSNVEISWSWHTPPDYTQVGDYMDELIDFINEDHWKKFDLIKISLAHHRFVWIHPFKNWNWRMVRLLTYALLLKYWYDFNQISLMNTSSLLCLNRKQYYKFLEEADNWDKENLLKWCEFATSSMCAEVKNIKKFFNGEFVNSILEKWIKKLREEKIVDEKESEMLKLLYSKWGIDNKTIQENLWYDTSIISRKFRHLKEIWLITHFWKTKQYIPLYENRIIFMDIYHNLIKAGFNSWSILDEPEWLSEVLPK